jgi:hypothetical protein
MLQSLTKDIRFGIRQLRKSPGFTIVAVFSLALGLGANMAIFQLVNAIRLKSLPVEKPQELATINFQSGSRRAGWWSSRSAQFTYGQLREIRARQEAFTGVLAGARSVQSCKWR